MLRKQTVFMIFVVQESGYISRLVGNHRIDKMYLVAKTVYIMYGCFALMLCHIDKG